MNFQKTYMSRAVSRAMAAEHPVGDPFGGPAFGERNDPVSAAISIGTMFATGSAMMAGSVMVGIAFAGAAVSLVGNITGNKTLMQIGAVAGIVGGLGSMGAFGETAQSATWSSLGSSAATPASTVAPLASTPSADMSAASATTPWGGTTALTPAPSAAAAPSGVTQAVPTPSMSSAPINAQGVQSAYGQDIFKTATMPGGATATGTSATAAGNLGSATTQAADAYSGIVSADALGSQNTAFGNNITATGAAGGTTSAIQPQTMFEKAMGYGKGVMDFTKDNPMGAYLLANTAGGIADWLSGKTDAELEMLKAATAAKRAEEEVYGVRADAMRQEIEREKQRRANLNAGYQQVNAGVNVNPNAYVQQPWGQQQQPAGLIAGARTQ